MNSKQSIEYLIRRIYSKHAPSKSSEVSSLLEKYDGQENELFEKVCKKYGVSEHEIKVFEAELNSSESKADNGLRKKAILILICLLAIVTVLFIVKASSENAVNEEVKETILIDSPSSEIPIETKESVSSMPEQIVEESEAKKFENLENHYVVLRKTHFHDSTTGSSKRKAYLVEGEIFSSKIEKDGFLFVEFVNPKGQKTIGWIQEDNSIAQTDSKRDSGKSD